MVQRLLRWGRMFLKKLSDRSPWLAPEFRDLLTLAGVCVINGRLVAFLGGEVWDIAEICEMGLLSFSGPGSLTAAMRLRGTFGSRLAQVVGIYLAISIGAVTVAAMYPFFASLLPANVRLFIGLHLLGLGLRLGDVPGLRQLAQWEGFEAAMKVMLTLILAQGILRGLAEGTAWHLSLHVDVLGALAITLGLGFGLTVIGLVMGLLDGAVHLLQPFKRGAAGSLLANALVNYLGVPIPSAVPLPPLVLMMGPLAIGILWTIVIVVRSARKQVRQNSRP